MTKPQPNACVHDWKCIVVEMLRDYAEAVNLDLCTRCGQYRLSWWWPKDSGDSAMQSELLIASELGEKFRAATEYAVRKALFQTVERP